MATLREITDLEYMNVLEVRVASLTSIIEAGLKSTGHDEYSWDDLSELSIAKVKLDRWTKEINQIKKKYGIEHGST